MRQIVLDTETTGLSHQAGHRVIEIGCVELINRSKTKNHFHHYINPGREVDEGALAVHGITDEFLADKPTFSSLVDDFIQYVDGAELIIHNASFDMGFLDNELALVKYKNSLTELCDVIDTLKVARKKHPGQKNNLDALCKRYGIDNSGRQLHGALLDAEILAEVYLVMTGGQSTLFTEGEQSEKKVDDKVNMIVNFKKSAPLKVVKADETELAAHQAWVDLLSKNQKEG